MTPNAKSWLASAGLGLLVGWAMHALLVLIWPAVVGTVALPDSVLILTPFVFTIVAAILLRRAGDMRQRFGWALSTTGIGFILGALFTMVSAGLLEILLSGAASPDGAGAVFVLLLALPFIISGAAMTVVGLVLLRRKPASPVANSPISMKTGDR